MTHTIARPLWAQFTAVASLMLPLQAIAGEPLFADDFDDGLSDRWEVRGYAESDYRIVDGALEVRVPPGDTPKERWIAVTVASEAADAVRASVDVSPAEAFTEPGEYGGLLYNSGGGSFAVRTQRIDRKLMYAPPRYRLLNGRDGTDPLDHEVVYRQVRPGDGPLNILIDRGYAYFQVGPGEGSVRWSNHFYSAVTRDPSSMTFAVVTGNGPADQEHWVRFDNFRVEVER